MAVSLAFNRASRVQGSAFWFRFQSQSAERLAHQSIEHDGNPVNRGVQRHRVKLAAGHTGRQAFGKIIFQAASDFLDALAADAIRVLEAGRTATDRQAIPVGHLFDNIKMECDEALDFFKLGKGFSRQVVQVVEKRFEDR